ncbi:MBL fold metallo-hydrolase [Paenisporosarcina cavernae]|uniref:MBL fold metallo-hydrolase n=2 Tax=Paenisporosarcina cavernae TaxID=2320858 RepID=A0A385YV81_9BACL|nr:MBL fold metallo-hydrolase [Paenisporosarcina cavernae]
MTFTWLKGGMTYLDGGAMFGVVPKALWSKKYPVNDKNQIELPTDPILIQYQGKNLLVDTGVGNGKMSDKQLRNYGVTEQSTIDDSLATLGLLAEDIDYVLLTHMHFDHACGLSKWENGVLVPSFPNARIIVSKIEFEEMKNPNIRSRNTYWKENWEPVVNQISVFEGRFEVLDGIEMIHTGGHSDGHSILLFSQGDEKIVHMADIMPTHAHQNPLWVLAYDDYPMTSVFAKEKWMKEALTNGYYFSFYHDAFYRLLKWTTDGKEILEAVERTN